MLKIVHPICMARKKLMIKTSLRCRSTKVRLGSQQLYPTKILSLGEDILLAHLSKALNLSFVLVANLMSFFNSASVI